MGIKSELAKSNTLIVKSNYIVEASYKLSLQEQRIIYILASKIKKDDNNFKPYRFTVREFSEIIGTRHKDLLSEVANHVNALKARELTIIKKNSVLKINWLSSVEYFNDGVIELCFDNKLKPYLLELKERFTKIDLNKVVSFNSNYSCRIYELLKQYETLRERTVEIDKLKEMFCIEPYEYKFYADFKRKVILQAQKEINSKTDLYFDFEEIKTSRKVTSIKFIIKSSGIPMATSEVNTLDKLDDIDDILGIMDKHNISKADAKKIHKAASGDMKKIMKCYTYTLTQNVDNVVAYMIRLCKEFSEPITNKSNAGSKTKNKFMNFEQTPYDFEKIEKMEIERTLKNMGKLK